MALILVSQNTTSPNYTALSTDVTVSNTIAGASSPGKTVYITDTGVWYIVKNDLTLAAFTLPVNLAVGDTVAIDQGTEGTTNGVSLKLAGAAVSASNPIPVSGGMAAVNQTVTRPTGTDIYAAKDAISNSTSAPVVITFTNVARVNGGSGYITGLRFFTSQVTNTASYRLHLYHTAPTPINDNAAFALLYANSTKRIGYIDITNVGTEGTGSDCASGINTDIRLPFACAANSRNIIGSLETLTGFTPDASQTFFFEMTADLN